MDQQQQHQQQSKACLNCPRCNSTNTKFCYYNNYSLSQPRHFCKACKRYWTRGGSLSNIPVGGGCRKDSKRVKRVHLPASSLSLFVDTLPSSSNQVSQKPTSTLQAAIETPSNLVTPLFYSSYKDNRIEQQQCNIYSNLNVNPKTDQTDALFLSSFNNHVVECQSLGNVAPLSSVSRQANTSTYNQAASHLLERLFPFQAAMQQQLPSSTVANGDHHMQGGQQGKKWNTSHVDHDDPRNSSSVYWGSTRNLTPRPPNHLANLDG